MAGVALLLTSFLLFLVPWSPRGHVDVLKGWKPPVKLASWRSEQQRIARLERDRKDPTDLLERISPEWYHRNDPPRKITPAPAPKREWVDVPQAAPLHPNEAAPKERSTAGDSGRSQSKLNVLKAEKDQISKKPKKREPVVGDGVIDPVKDEVSRPTVEGDPVLPPETKEDVNVPPLSAVQENEHPELPDTSEIDHHEPPQIDAVEATTDEATPSHRILRTLDNMDTVHKKCSDSFPRQVTLVIQSTPDRLPVLRETCHRWKDPMVIVVASNETAKLDCPQAQIIHHPLTATYPVNQLRNVGIDAVRTSHMMILDVDFVPSWNLSGILQRYLEESEHKALVVPAFERKSSCTTDCMEQLEKDPFFVPGNLPQLKDCLLAKDCIVFQSDINWEGHHSTRSDEWITSTELRRLECLDSLRYEPYVVLERCPAPFYDERFHGYGKNKIEYIQHLRLSGYEFAVVPEAFVVHVPHQESTVKEEWKDTKSSSLHKDMDKLYPQFLRELMQKYRNVTGFLDLCPRKKN